MDESLSTWKGLDSILPDTGIHRYKDTRILGYKDTGIQGYKDTRI